MEYLYVIIWIMLRKNRENCSRHQCFIHQHAKNLCIIIIMQNKQF